MPKNAPKYVWRPGSARTRSGRLSVPPDPLAAIEVVLGGTRTEKRGKDVEGRDEGERRGREGEGSEGRGKGGGREGKGCGPLTLSP